MTLFRRFLNSQIWLSQKFDALFLPADMLVVGWREFYKTHVPDLVKPGMKIYDIGSGKRPSMNNAFGQDRPNDITIIGMDIDQDELKQAPEGAYDETRVADICAYDGDADGDLAICGCLMEHVPDMKSALKGATSTLKPGGQIILFAPSRNAAFARLNMILPEKFKNKLLKALYPKHESDFIGFKAHYDHCTPGQIEKILTDLGLTIEESNVHYFSNYFMFFTPVHLVWRLYQLVIRLCGWRNGAENFIIRARK